MKKEKIKYLLNHFYKQENGSMKLVHKRIVSLINDDFTNFGMGRISNIDINNIWVEFNKMYPS